MSTVDEIWQQGEQRMEPEVRDYILGGAGREQSIARNREAIDRVVFLPRLLSGVQQASAEVRLLGARAAAPVFTAPVGSLNLIFPGAAEATLRAARSVGVTAFAGLLGLESLEHLDDLKGGNTVLQLYLRGDEAWLRRIVALATERGFQGFCVTVDSPAPAFRPRDRRNGFQHRRVLGTSKNVTVGSEGREQQASLTWERLARVRDMTDLPLVIKGVLRPEDARHAVELGFDAVYVSNHGGRNLGSTPAPIEVLPEVVRAVPPNVAVLVDGGFRDGEDVAKALALGAAAVGLGRAHCLALAAGGQEGLERMLATLVEQLETTMVILGARNVAELDRSLLVAPRDEYCRCHEHHA